MRRSLGTHPSVIGRGQIEIHFPGERRFELLDLQIDNDEAAQTKVRKEQVQIVVLASNFEVILAADEGKALAQFQDRGAQVIEQAAFHFTFKQVRAQRQELEIIGTVDELLGKFGFFCGQNAREVCERFTLQLKQLLGC